MQRATGSVTGAFAALALVGVVFVRQQGCSHYWRLDASVRGPRVAGDGHVLVADVVATEHFVHQLGVPRGFAADPCVARDETHFHCVLPPGTVIGHDAHIEGNPVFWRIGQDWAPPRSARFEIDGREVRAWRAEAELTQLMDVPATGPDDGGPTPWILLYVELATPALARVEVTGIERNEASPYDYAMLESPGVYRVQVQRPFAARARQARVIAMATAFGPCVTQACAPPASALQIVSMRLAREGGSSPDPPGPPGPR